MHVLGEGPLADEVRAAGVSAQALREASTICALFNMIVRLADSFGWDVPEGPPETGGYRVGAGEVEDADAVQGGAGVRCGHGRGAMSVVATLGALLRCANCGK